LLLVLCSELLAGDSNELDAGLQRIYHSPSVQLFLRFVRGVTYVCFSKSTWLSSGH
jgi:hypothetical protein